MPKSIAGKNPISRLFTVLLPPLNKFILKTPRKLRPKRITINPEIKFTAPLYSRRILPMVPANAPIATKTTVNPLTNPNAPDKVFFCTAFSTTCKIGDIDGQHGKQAGDMKVIMPSRKATAYCMSRCTPFRKYRKTASR